MKTVYLCGAIEGLDREGAYAWRKEAKEALQGNYKILDPLDNDALMSRKEIFEADIKNVEEADILLTEMSHHDKAYIGTSMELWHAYQKGKEVILWGSANRENLFLEQTATRRFPTLKMAIWILTKRVKQS